MGGAGSCLSLRGSGGGVASLRRPSWASPGIPIHLNPCRGPWRRAERGMVEKCHVRIVGGPRMAESGWRERRGSRLNQNSRAGTGTLERVCEAAPASNSPEPSLQRARVVVGALGVVLVVPPSPFPTKKSSPITITNRWPLRCARRRKKSRTNATTSPSAQAERRDTTLPTSIHRPLTDTMVKRKVAALEKVEADLVNLQYKIRRDPRYALSPMPPPLVPSGDVQCPPASRPHC